MKSLLHRALSAVNCNRYYKIYNFYVFSSFFFLSQVFGKSFSSCESGIFRTSEMFYYIDLAVGKYFLLPSLLYLALLKIYRIAVVNVE